MELAGKVALVTGGSGDLGSAICRALARSRMDVAVTYVGEKERAERVVAEIEAAGCRAWAIHLDQSTNDQPDSVVASTAEHFGRLDDVRIAVEYGKFLGRAHRLVTAASGFSEARISSSVGHQSGRSISVTRSRMILRISLT